MNGGHLKGLGNLMVTRPQPKFYVLKNNNYNLLWNDFYHNKHNFRHIFLLFLYFVFSLIFLKYKDFF